MCRMLLSINPQHVDNIMSGKKKYEFRKVRCKENVDKIVIYATSPVMQVVGEADVLDVIEDSPETVWEMTCKQAGISKTFYDSYYQGKKKAVAFKLGNITKYEFPLSLSDFGIGFAPQSFMYVKTHI
ncbi:MAG: hypothetical protein E7476_03405 [Ruminococcaceae bacterium]|nr:hypothetical protein [Oscillospiraceae bacterium]